MKFIVKYHCLKTDTVWYIAAPRGCYRNQDGRICRDNNQTLTWTKDPKRAYLFPSRSSANRSSGGYQICKVDALAENKLPM